MVNIWFWWVFVVCLFILFYFGFILQGYQLLKTTPALFPAELLKVFIRIGISRSLGSLVLMNSFLLSHTIPQMDFT